MSSLQATVRLSVIDLLDPTHIIDRVSSLDALGYHRYWTTEHHTSGQSGSPTVAAAVAAGAARRLRVGTAGVLLTLHSPRRIAEDFRLLEAIHPGRIDLGVAGASTGERARTELLDGRPEPSRDTYAHKVRTLAHMMTARDDIGPHGQTVPEFWICGVGERSARLAGALGASYAFHHYLARREPRYAAVDAGAAATAPPVSRATSSSARCQGPSSVDVYRASFTASSGAYRARPTVSVACYGMCATTTGRAHELWRTHYANIPDGASARASFLGDPAACRAQLERIIELYDADELVVQCMTSDLDAQLEGYGLLAEALGLRRQWPMAARESRLSERAGRIARFA